MREELQLAFTEYAQAEGAARVEAKRRYLEKLRVFSYRIKARAPGFISGVKD